MMQRVLKEIDKGRQVYHIIPLIEESEALSLKSLEKMRPELESQYGEKTLAFVHGKMKYEEREKILQDFKSHKYQVLVATTVVEVGVDVPNASVMIIENAERYGLSQLHQLRGRVGRGEHESFCFLMATHMGSDEIKRRLKTLEATQDGFKIAEVDLEMRGPGEFLGTRQSGLPVFEMARLPRDFDLLQLARRDAFQLVKQDPGLKNHPMLLQFLKEWSGRLELS